MMKPRVWVSNGKNTIAIPQESLPAVIASIEPAVADIVAAYKIAVAPDLDSVSLIKLSLHLPAGVTPPAQCRLNKNGSLKSGVLLSILTDAGIGLDDDMALVIKVEKPAVFETVAETAAKPQLLPNVTAEEAYKQLSSVGLANVERLLDTKIKRADEKLILKYFASRAQLIRQEICWRENDLEINGVFSSGNPSRATLLTAFKSGRPMLLKISSQPEQEILIWESLFPKPYQENSFHLVGPLELVNFPSSGDKFPTFESNSTDSMVLRSGILMPIYLAALEQVPKPMKEALALKVYKDMLIALNHIHQLGFCHADIKPANIFIDADGRYFLGDFGACVRIGANLFEGSVNYVPKKVGFPQVGSAGLDHLLLVVTVLEKLARLDVGNGFEVEELISCIEKIRDTALVDCLRVSLDFASEVLNQ